MYTVTKHITTLLLRSRVKTCFSEKIFGTSFAMKLMSICVVRRLSSQKTIVPLKKYFFSQFPQKILIFSKNSINEKIFSP